MNETIIVKVDRELEELIPLFLETRARDMATLQTSLASNDFAAMKVVGHGMKGSGGAFGFGLVTKIGDIIEAAAIKGDKASVEHQLAVLRDYLARVEIQYV